MAVSYKDPRWDELEAAIGAKHGVPPELLASIRTYGERSNSDQVSSAGARSVYQIIPETRASILKKHGIDPYLSDENAVEGAALLLRESLDRNNGDPIQAAGEYHGGPDRSRWGPINAAYRKRVAQGLQQYAALDTIATDAPAEPSISELMDAYRSGKMDPEARSDFEQDGRNGLLAIPARFQDEILGPKPERAPPDLVEAYQSGKMSPEARADFEADVNAGLLILPEQEQPGSFASNFVDPEIAAARQAAQPERMGAPGGPALPPAEQIPIVTFPLPEQFNDFRSMPELNQLSMSGAKAGIGSALAGSPTEVAQILKANYPDIQLQETPDGIIATSGMDGIPYLIPNKASMRDLPAAAIKMAPYAALGPAGAATSVWGGAGINLAQQKAREWAGGRPTDYGEVLTSGLVAGAAPVVAPLAAAGVGALANRMRPATNAADDAAAAMRPPQASAPEPAQAQTTGAPIPDTAPPPAQRAAAANVEKFPPLPDETMGRRAVPAAQPPGASVSAEVQPINIDDLAELSRAAAEGDSEAAKRIAQFAEIDDETVQAAREALAYTDPVESLPLSMLTANRQFLEIEGLARSQKGSALNAQYLAAQQDISKRGQQLITDLGAYEGPAAMDAAVKDRLAGLIDDIKKAETRDYNLIRKTVPVTTPVSAPRTLAYLTERSKYLRSRFPSEERSLLAELEQGKVPYGMIDSARRDVGEAIGNSRAKGAFKDANDYDNAQFYKRLQDDVAEIAEQNGLTDVAQRAIANTKARKRLEEFSKNLVGKHLADSMITKVESGVKALQKGDVSKLVKVMKNVPEDMREAVMATGVRAAANGSFRKQGMSFAAYADWYDGLKANPQAMALVMSNLPAQAPQKLAALAKMARAVSKASGTYTTTGASLQMALRENLNRADGFLNRLFGLARSSMAGAASYPLAKLFGVISGGMQALVLSAVEKGKPEVLSAIDALISSPEIVYLVKSLGTPAEPAAVKALARHGALSRLFKMSGTKASSAERERWVSENFQADDAQ